MKNWLFMFRPDTYAKVREHGIVGVRDGVQKRFREIKKGDRFVVYVSRVQQFDGHGEVTSDPFEDDTLIFAHDQIYANRVRVRFDKTGAARAAGDALWGLSAFHGTLRTPPTNLILCRGGFIDITSAEYDALSSWIAGRTEAPWPRAPKSP